MMRKAFFHIVEVMIVAMLVFVIMMQFYSIPRAEPQWGIAKLTVMAQDLAYALDAKLEDQGDSWLDPGAIRDVLNGELPGSMAYSVNVLPSVRPLTRIGCVCDAGNYTILRDDIFTDFTLNGISRQFELDQIGESSLDLSEGSSDSDNDVIVFCGYPSLSTSQVDGMMGYLSEGHGVVQISSLTESMVSQRWHQDVFGLEWAHDTYREPSATADFVYFDPSEKRYEVEKLFLHADSSVARPFDGFGNFASESVYPDDGIENRILVRQADKYVGGPFDEKPVPLAVIDWGVNGSGRTAWMSWTPIDGSGESVTEARQLLRSLVLWASAGRPTDVIATRMNQGVRSTFRKVYDSDMYEAMRVELTIGYHY